MKNLILCLLAVCLLTSCHKNPGPRPTVLNMSDYPVNTGNSWTYQVFDSILNTTDTAVFKVNSKTVLKIDTNLYNYQTMVNGSIVDSGYIVQTANSYTYSSYTGNALFANIKFRFPIYMNGTVAVQFPQDTVYGLSVLQRLTVLANNFTSVYQLQRNLSMPDFYLEATLDVVPGIGIVQEDFSAGSWIPRRKTIRLISYNIH